MITLTKTLTMTTLAVLIAALMGVWLATTTPANSTGEHATPSVDVDVRLGNAEFAICAGQAWPHFTDGCAAWISASSDTDGIDRSISLAVHDADHGFSVVSKAQPLEVAAR